MNDVLQYVTITCTIALAILLLLQTISISKAGIQATLNARTSILAAANPIMGIYDPTKTLRQNVAISPPIMSRFDLFFVVCDNPDETADRRTATHIVNVHQKREEALRGRDGEDDPLPMDVLQGYVQYARTINPQMTPAAQEAVIKAYIALRQDDSLGANKASYRITVRQLESLIRLSEALARLHLDTEVREKYVTEGGLDSSGRTIEGVAGNISLRETSLSLVTAVSHHRVAHHHHLLPALCCSVRPAPEVDHQGGGLRHRARRGGEGHEQAQRNIDATAQEQGQAAGS